MKKITLFSASLLCCVTLFLSFSSKKNAEAIVNRPPVNIVECFPATPFSGKLTSAAEFKARFGAEPVRTRKSVYALTQAEINALKVGIIKMKALPITDPTSWGYQAAIHGTTRTDNLPSWNTCHKSGEAFFFFSWHRMYLYFFERILRAKSGRASLAQPYWNYQLNAVIPPSYRDNAASNPLYDGTRTSTMNNGGALPSSIMTSFASSLNQTDFTTFQTNLNNGPHGSVHTTISGNMAVVTAAAQDPVFWLHHANIDRLWEEWRSRCGGRANPTTDSEWMNKIFTFFDETGTAVNMRGSDVIEIANQLYYRYDDREPNITCAAARPSVVINEPLITKEVSFSINSKTQKTAFTGASTTKLDAFIASKNRSVFNFSSATAPERLVVNFDGVTIGRMPAGVVEVYLNLPAGQTPNPNGNNFVGLFDLFSVEHHAAHGTAAEHQNGAGTEMDATNAAKALGLTLPELRNATLSFFVRGASLKGKESLTEVQIGIKNITFTVQTRQIQ